MSQESRYSKVFVKIWHSKDFRAISEDGKMLFMYLLSSPHRNMGGFYYLPLPYLCYDVDLDEKRITKALQELADRDMVLYDFDAQVVLIKKWFCYNPIENENQAKGLNKQLAEIPKSKLFESFVNCVKEHCKYTETILKGFDIPFENPSETLSKPYTKPGTGTGTGTEKERDINSAHDEQDDADDKPDNTPQNFDAEIKRINDKSFEFGMNGITPEFMDDAEARLKEGTDPDLIVKALSIGATKANGGSSAKCRYAISVLQGWAQEGIRTLKQWEAKYAPAPKARDKPKTKAEEKEEAFQKAREAAYRMLQAEGVISGDTG